MFSKYSYHHTAHKHTDGQWKKTELTKPVWEEKSPGLGSRTPGLSSPSCVFLSKILNFWKLTFFTCQRKVLSQLILELPSSSAILGLHILRRTSHRSGDFSIMLFLLTKYIKPLGRSWDASSLPTVESSFQRFSNIKEPDAQKLEKGVVYMHTRQSLSKQDELSLNVGFELCYDCNSKENFPLPWE